MRYLIFWPFALCTFAHSSCLREEYLSMYNYKEQVALPQYRGNLIELDSNQIYYPITIMDSLAVLMATRVEMVGDVENIVHFVQRNIASKGFIHKILPFPNVPGTLAAVGQNSNDGFLSLIRGDTILFQNYRERWPRPNLLAPEVDTLVFLDFAITQDGNHFVLAGYIVQNFIGLPIAQFPCVIKTNLNGDPVWFKRYNLAYGNAKAERITPLPDGNLLLWTKDADGVRVIKIQEDGAFTFVDATLPLIAEARGLPLQELPNGHFLVAGKSPLGVYQGDITLIEVGPNCEVMAEVRLGTTEQVEAAYAMTMLRNGNMALVGTRRNPVDNSIKILLYELRSNYEVEWETEHPASFNEHPYDIIQLKDYGLQILSRFSRDNIDFKVRLFKTDQIGRIDF